MALVKLNKNNVNTVALMLYYDFLRHHKFIDSTNEASLFTNLSIFLYISPLTG